MKIYCDRHRHLICVPYTIENLHKIAIKLGIKRCWFHNKQDYPHYDIPKKRKWEIENSVDVTVVSTRQLLEIIKL